MELSTRELCPHQHPGIGQRLGSLSGLGPGCSVGLGAVCGLVGVGEGVVLGLEGAGGASGTAGISRGGVLSCPVQSTIWL
jgi:hypothetical protein